MSATMAILTIGVAPVAEVLPLLTEHIREEQITHISLLGKMTREDVMEDYAVESGDQGLLTLLNDNQLVEVSRQRWSAICAALSRCWIGRNMMSFFFSVPNS